MDVTDLLRRLLRLRLAVAVVVVLALAAAAAGYLSAGESRRCGAAVVIVPPKIGDVAGGQNPFLSLDNNLAQFATVLASALQSSAVSDALSRQGATASYTVSTVTGSTPSFAQLSPQLAITVNGDTDALVSRTAAALVVQARSQLLALQQQAAVPDDQLATLVVVVPPTTPEVVSGGRLRSAGSLGVGVLILGLVVVLLADAALRKRADRRSGPADAIVSGPAPEVIAAPPPSTEDERSRTSTNAPAAPEHDAPPETAEPPPSNNSSVDFSDGKNDAGHHRGRDVAKTSFDLVRRRVRAGRGR